MAYKGIRLHEKHLVNPFLEEAVDNIKIVRKTQRARLLGKNTQLIVDEKTGEVTGYSQFLNIIQVDEERFIKMYLSKFGIFSNLNSSAIKVFGYIINVLKPKKDTFFFKLDDAKKHTKYAQDASVFTGLENLIANGIIARTTYDWEYYINPMVFFNGNRVEYVKTYFKNRKANKEINTELNNNEKNIENFNKETNEKIESESR